MELELTEEQQLFVSYADEFNQYQLKIPNLFVEARAGSAKTTTMVLFAQNIDPKYRMLCVAFNRDIANELKDRMPENATCLTLNALGHRSWGKAIGRKLTLSQYKNSDILKELGVPFKEKDDLSRIMAIFKANGAVPIGTKGVSWNDTPIITRELIDDICVEFQFEIPPRYAEDGALRLLNTAMVLSIEQAKEGLIDFDDQLYMPAVFSAPFESYKIVMIDEAQDVSPIQIRLLSLITTSSFGKRVAMLVAVGDPYQAIYGFRGADEEAVHRIIDQWECEVIRLTTCFRCREAIIEKANDIVADIKAFKDGGKVENFEYWSAADLKLGDAVLCRNNAPLISNALRLLATGKPVKILGRDIGLNLIRLIEKADTDNLLVLPDRLNNIFKLQQEKLLAKGKIGQVALLEDKFTCIQILIDSLPPGSSVRDLKEKIENLFAKTDTAHVVNFATVHKAKGREWDRVFILDPWLMPSRYAETPSAIMQEKNIEYVAITRAKDFLGYINSNGYRG